MSKKVLKIYAIEMREPNPSWMNADDLKYLLETYTKARYYSVKEIMVYPPYDKPGILAIDLNNESDHKT